MWTISAFILHNTCYTEYKNLVCDYKTAFIYYKSPVIHIWFDATQLNTPKQVCRNSNNMGKVLSPMVCTPESDAMCSKTLILPADFFLQSVKIKKIHFSFGKFKK